MENSYPIIEMGLKFTFYGIPIHFSYWTLLLAAFLVYDSRTYLIKILPGSKHHHYWVAAVCASLAILISTVLHELNHALAAYWLDDGITEAGMSWWGAYVKPVHNMLETTPLTTIVIGVVGPSTNLAISLILLILVKIFGESISENTFQYIGIMNFKFGILNFLPLFITDGGKVLFGFLHLLFSTNTALGIMLAISGLTIAYLIFRPDDHFRISTWFKEIAEEQR